MQEIQINNTAAVDTGDITVEVDPVNQLTKQELVNRLKYLGVSGYSKLNKAGIVKLYKETSPFPIPVLSPSRCLFGGQ